MAAQAQGVYALFLALAGCQRALSGAAAVNSTRRALRERLCGLGVPLEIGSGGQTKYNRSRQGYAKTHWLDAVCVGVSGERVFVAAEQDKGVSTPKSR